MTILLSVILPLIFKEDSETFNETLNIIAALISSIAGLITLLIAILLFNKFGIETPLLEKKTEVVFKFIEEYKKVRFFVSGNKYGLMIRLHNPNDIAYEDWYGEKLVFPVEYSEGLNSLMKISENPFMPKTITEKLAKINFYHLVMDVDDEKLEEYAKVTVQGQSIIENKFGRFNGKDMTLFEFLNLVDELRNEIIDWVNNNSNYSFDLNI